MRKASKSAVADLRFAERTAIGAVAKLLPGEDFEAAIRRLWDEGKARWMAIGELLLEWKGDAAHGEFMRLVAAQLPFDHGVANKLMAIAEAVKAVPALLEHLPPTYTVAYEAVTLPEPVRAQAIADGRLTRSTPRRAIVEMKQSLKEPLGPLARRAALEARRDRLRAELEAIEQELSEIG